MPRVLSIQSHVVHGYVGNKAAVFPLQLLGFDVDSFNSVNYSNHTAYPGGIAGKATDENELKDILNGLEKNSLLEGIGYVLTGYIGSAAFSKTVAEVIETIRKYNDRVVYVCDPVLGDNGKFYVPESLVGIYKSILIPVADTITPNAFEAEQLSGVKLNTMPDFQKACQILHQMGPKTIFVTSVVVGVMSRGAQEISILASCRKTSLNKQELWQIKCPMIPGSFTGTGDLTASLLLGHLAKIPDNIPMVMENVINTVYAVVRRTHTMSGPSAKSRELKLIESKRDIENPPSIFKARLVSANDISHQRDPE